MFDVFKQFLKCIYTNNEGENIGAFRHYCMRSEIKHEILVPKTTQHNDIDERMNITIVERVRTMLS